MPDPSVFVKFRLNGPDQVSLLAWTTTPWTLPGNVALAVHPDASYVEVEQGGERLILARERVEVLEGDYRVVAEVPGRDLLGLATALFTDLLLTARLRGVGGPRARLDGGGDRDRASTAAATAGRPRPLPA